MSSNPPGRIAHIDLMEALGMFLVVTYHLSNCAYKFLEDPAPWTYINYYLRCVFVCCVPLFLVANGCLLFHHSLDLKKHLKKTLRYAVLTLFWGVATLLEYNWVYGISYGISGFIADLLTWRDGVIHLWYMGALVIIYLVFPVLKLVYDRDRKRLWYVIAMLAVFTFGNQLLNHICTIAEGFLGRTLYWVEMRNWFSMFNPVPEIPAYTMVYFCLGAFLPEFQEWLEKFPRRRVNLLAAAGILVLCGVHAVWFGLLWRSATNYICPIWYGYETITGALIALGVVTLCLGYRGRWQPGAKVVRWISENTLGIYFLHLAVIYPIREWLLHFRPLYNYPGNLLCGALVLAVCTLLTAGLRKAPGLRWLVS